jgi:hypothetical protein
MPVFMLILGIGAVGRPGPEATPHGAQAPCSISAKSAEADSGVVAAYTVRTHCKSWRSASLL